jgi:hypothetical protein
MTSIQSIHLLQMIRTLFSGFHRTVGGSAAMVDVLFWSLRKGVVRVVVIIWAGGAGGAGGETRWMIDSADSDDRGFETLLEY